MRGRLLVAAPALLDPNFDRTVVLLIEHDDGGAIGLILNRPGEIAVVDGAPEWAPYAAAPARVFWGGPVQPGAAFCLTRVRCAVAAETWSPIVDAVGVADIGRSPEAVPGGVEVARVFSGYAGWSGGQLEHELADEGWYVVDTLPSDPFAAEPLGLWRAVLRRQQAPLSWVANFPDDPDSN